MREDRTEADGNGIQVMPVVVASVHQPWLVSKVIVVAKAIVVDQV